MGILPTEGGLTNRPYMAAWAGLWGETRRWRSTGGCKQSRDPPVFIRPSTMNIQLDCSTPSSPSIGFNLQATNSLTPRAHQTRQRISSTSSHLSLPTHGVHQNTSSGSTLRLISSKRA